MIVVNYSNLADRIPEWRTIKDAVDIVMQCNPDYLFRAFQGGGRPIPESPATAYDQFISCGYTESEAKKLAWFMSRYGLTYSHLKMSINEVKSRKNIEFSVVEHTQYVYKHVWDPITLEPIKDTKPMALDFSKWDLINPETKRKFDLRSTQIFCAKRMGIVQRELVVNGGMRWITDITNESFRKWIKSRLKRYKRLGVDTIHYDILFGHARVAYEVVKWMRDNGYYKGDPFNHPAVVDLYNAACKIVDIAKSLGFRVETWIGIYVRTPYKMPKLDGVYMSPTSKEILKIKFDESRWRNFVKITKDKLGNVRLYSFIDNGGLDTYPMHALSQKLSPKLQCLFFTEWDKYMRDKGIIPVYPLHDGVMGATIIRKSFGKYPIYDATAPEFNTYDCIKNLIKKDYRFLILVGAAIAAGLIAYGLRRLS